MKNFKMFFYFLVLSACASCKDDTGRYSRETEIRDRYYNLENIGWKSRVCTQKADDIDFSAAEVPLQYYLLKNFGKANLVLADSIYERYKLERVLEFTFEHEQDKNLLAEEFTGLNADDAVKYMSFGLFKDFFAVTSRNDTIPCLGATYEPNYKAAPYERVLLFFSGINPNEKIKLIYRDSLFGKGTLVFKFKDTNNQIAL